jgi:hypothetical protein
MEWREWPAFTSMSDHELRVAIIKLARMKPEPKGIVREIQTILEQRYVQELASASPDQRRLADLKSSIQGIDMSYLQDKSEYGTMEWRAKHPWPPVNEDGAK